MISTADDVLIYNQPDCILPKSFFEGRFPPNVHPDSLDYSQWWDQQEERAKNGFSDGGYSVTGPYYHHLNFKEINMLDEYGRPMLGHPYYAYEDQELFNDVDKARKAGKGLILVTFRGFGKSFDIATICEHEFIYYEASECIISASTDFYASRLWSKIELGLNSVPEEFRPNLLADRPNYKESGYKDAATKKIHGMRSMLHKVVYADNPGKTRGTRPNIHVFEEIGSWVGAAKLIQCFKMTEASWWRGARYTCFPALIGTGGEMETGGSEDAKRMFYNPDPYNLMAFEYKEKKIGRFIPAYKKFEGFYEESGVSDEKGAFEFLKNRRAEKESDFEMYKQETMEFPFEPEEAFQVIGYNSLPTDLLEQQFNNIWRDPLLQVIEKGDLKPVYKGKNIVDVIFIPDEKGPFEFVKGEHPRKGPDGFVIPNLYISGCDSFDAVLEKNKNPRDQSLKGRKSSGSIFVFKRFWNARETGRIFVAKITQRTDDAEEFYKNTVLLNIYYRCRMLFEYSKIGIGRHYVTNNLTQYLYPRPNLEALNIVKRSVATQKYGVQMPEEVKNHIVNTLYKEYIREKWEEMYFLSQLEDGIRFTWGSNEHDETMAAAIALLEDEDMYDVEIKTSSSKVRRFPKYRRDQFGNLIFD